MHGLLDKPFFNGPRTQADYRQEADVVYAIVGWRLGERVRVTTRDRVIEGVVVYAGVPRWWNKDMPESRRVQHWTSDADYEACKVQYRRGIVPWHAPLCIIMRENRPTVAGGERKRPLYHAPAHPGRLERLSPLAERVHLPLVPRPGNWSEKADPPQRKRHPGAAPPIAHGHAPPMDRESNPDMEPIDPPIKRQSWTRRRR